jgi:membrane-bound metal-dependent hydrolase YbcI (DUF457 family)
MPTPLGHALAGIAAGGLVNLASPTASRCPLDRRRAALYALMGMLPDADLLFGAHSGPTHGLGAALIVGLIVFALARLRFGKGVLWLAVACACGYASHTLLDWLGTDTSPPIGIMALWPMSREYYESGLHVFMAVSRRFWRPEEFWGHNLIAIGRELVILIPLVGIVLFVTPLRHRSPARTRPKTKSRETTS